MRFAFLSLAAAALLTPTHVACGEPDGNAQAIALEVVLLKCNRQLDSDEIAALSGPSGAVAAKVAELDSDGYVDSINRIRMATVESQQASIQIGETVWIPTGASRQVARGASQRTYQRENIGTIITATSSVAGEAVIVEFELEKSQLQRTEGEDESTPPESETLKARGTLRIPGGSTVLASGFDDKRDDESSSFIVLASAKILGPPPQDVDHDKRHVRIFSLQHSPAEEAAKVVRELLADDNPGQIRIAVHSRTNSLVIAARSEDALATIEAILQRLDREASPPQAASGRRGDNSAYKNLDKGELQAQLKMLQNSLLEAEAEVERMQAESAVVSKAYRSAEGDARAEAFLRMIEAEAAMQKPFKRLQAAKYQLASAKRAYLQLLTEE